jgi:hypothetical protein
MESGWRADGERMESGWRADGERMESGWRADGERTESGSRAPAEWGPEEFYIYVINSLVTTGIELTFNR